MGINKTASGTAAKEPLRDAAADSGFAVKRSTDGRRLVLIFGHRSGRLRARYRRSMN